MSVLVLVTIAGIDLLQSKAITPKASRRNNRLTSFSFESLSGHSNRPYCRNFPLQSVKRRKV